MRKVILALSFLLCYANNTVFATTYYNKSSGTGALQTLSNWGTATNGTGTAPPNFTTVGSVFNLYNGSTATISGAWVMTSVILNVGNGTAAMNLTIPSSFSLTGTGTVYVSANATLTLQNTTNPTLGTLNAASTVNYNGTGAQTIATGTYGNLTLSGARSGAPAITLASGTINISGDFLVAYTGTPTFTTTGNTFIYNSTTSGQTIGGITYNNLTLDNTSGVDSAGGNITVSGTLATTSGGTLDMSAYKLNGISTITNNGTIRTECTAAAPIPTGETWAGSIAYNAAAGGQTIMAGTYANLTIGNTSGVNNPSGNLIVNGILTVAAGGTLDMTAAYTLTGTLATITNNGTIQTSVSTATSSTPFTSGKTWGGTGTVIYAAPGGAQKVMAGTYNCNLTSSSGGTNTASGVLTINSTLTIAAGDTLDMGANQLLGAGLTPVINGVLKTKNKTNPAVPTGNTWGGTVNFYSTNGGQHVPAGTYQSLIFSNASGTITVNGDLTVNTALVTTGGTLAMGAYQLSGTCTVTNNGTITTSCTDNPALPAGQSWMGSTGAVTFGLAAGGQFIPGGTYQTLKFSNTRGVNTATGNIVVNTGTMTTSSGGMLDMGTTYTLGGTGSFTNKGIIQTSVPTSVSTTPIPAGRALAGTIIYAAAAGGQTIVAETSYASLTLENTSGTNTSAGNITMTGTLATTAGGTLDMTAAYTMSGSPTITNNGIIKSSVPTSVSAVPFPSGRTWGGAGTVLYAAAAGGQTVMAGTYNCNLAIGNTSGINTASGVLKINGTLTTTSGGKLDMTTHAISGTGTMVNNGTITTSATTNPALPSGNDWTGTTGAVIFANATGGQHAPTGTYQTLKFSNTSGTDAAIGVLTVTNLLITTSGGTLAMGANQLLGAFTAQNNGTITTTSTDNPAIPAGLDWSGATGEVTFAHTSGGQFIPGGTYQTLEFSNNSGINTAVGSITVNDGIMTTTSGGTLDMGAANTLDGTATFTNNGTIQTSVPDSISYTPIPFGLALGGTINYAAAAGGQTVVGDTYNNLLLSNTSGTNTAGDNITVNGTMTTTAGGTLDMIDVSILSGTGTFTNNGTIQTSVPTVLSTTAIPPGTTWGGTIIYSSDTGSQTVVTETAYNNLVILNSTGSDTLNSNIVINGSLTTLSGVFDLGANDLGGALTSISGGGLIRTESTSATPLTAGKIWPQTIEYYNPAGGQTIVNGTYGGLANSNITSGANTAVHSGAIIVNGNLTLTPGSLLNDNGNTITVTGNIAGSGVHTGTGSISMTGGGGTIDSVTLNNLTLNNAGGFSLVNNPTINGTLTITSGRLNIGTDTLIFSASATAVAGTFSSAKMIVANGGGLVERQMSGAGSFLFPVGDNTAYSPVTLNFTGGTFTAGAFAGVNVTNTKHPQNANTTNYINRYWSIINSGVAGPVYNVSATYVPGDVTGTEANISMAQYDGALPWIKFGAANASTHTLTAAGVTAAASDFSGIATANAGVSVSPANTTICSGGSVVLTATGAGSPALAYSWAPSTGLSATSGASVTASPATTGTVSSVYIYTVTMTDGNGFTAVNTNTVTVQPVPVIAGILSACIGQTTALTGSIGGGAWSSSNTAKATVVAGTGIVTGVAAGTANITYTAATGCTAVSQVTVNAVPTAITGVNNACSGSTTTLHETIAGGVWGSSDSTIATVTQSGAVTGVSGGTATISYVSGAGCFVTDLITVGPILAVTGNTTACIGLVTSLSDATTGGVWSSSSNTIATIGSGTGIVTGVSAGSATITYALGAGCNRTTSITINAVPSAITGAASVCAGLTTALVETVTGGTWSSMGTTIATVGATGVVSGVSSGTVTISYISGAGCYVSKAESVNPLPAAITGATNVCPGLTTSLTDAGGGTWASSNTTAATVGSGSGVVTGVVAGTATVTYALSTGCIANTVVTVNLSPANISGTAAVCAGLNTGLSDATTGGKWSSGMTTVATIGSASGTVGGITAGTTVITYTLATGCIITNVATVNPLPSAISGAATVCTGLTTALTDAGGGTWVSSNTTAATVVSGTGVVRGAAAGTSTITYTLPTGCIATKVATVHALPAAITGTTNVCVGLTVTLHDATTGGTWAVSNTSIATSGSGTGVVTGITQGTALVTYTLPTGCTATSTETVNPLPAGITGVTTFCDQGTTSLADASTGGKWTSSDITNAVVGSASGFVSAVSSGPATITYTLPTGCIARTLVSVNALPSDINGASDVCVGDTIILSDPDAGGTWSSSNTANATIGAASAIVSGIVSGAATITYTLPTGCATASGVAIDPLPNAGTITGPAFVCNGSTIVLSNPAGGGVWTAGNTAIVDVDASGSVSGLDIGSTELTYTVTNSCGTAFDTAFVTVNPLPDAGYFIGNPTVCAGSSITLSASTTGGVWSSGTAAVATVGSASGIVSGVSAGGATVSYVVTNSCGVDENDTSLIVNPPPSAITGVTSVCPGATVSLTDAGGGTWHSGSTSVATIGAASAVVTGVAAGTSTITYTLSTGCTATTLFTVNPLPSSITGATTVCRGSTTALTDAGGGTWSSSNAAVATVGSGTGVVSPVAAGTSTITYTLPTGCKTTTATTVNNAPSLASATNNGPVCTGGTLTLTANTPSNVTGYSWSGPVSITGSTTASASVPSATAAAGGTYTVTVNNGAGTGCSVNYTTTAIVNATPTAAPTNNGPACTGGTVTLTANPAGGVTTYTWNGARISSTTAQNPTATPTVTTTYSLTVSNGSCSSPTVYTTTVTVNAIPAAAPTNNGPVCSGSTVMLTANPGGSANAYAWSGPNLSSATAQNPTATPTVTSVYSLTVAYGSGNPGCSPGTVYTTTVSVTAGGNWLGGTSANWNDATNWCGGVPSTTSNISIPGGVAYYPIITTGTVSANNITILSGGTLTVNGGTLQIAGTISNSGTFNASNGSIVMNGATAQTIPASTFSANTINNLTVSNSAGVTLGGALNISGIMKAATGNLNTGGYLTLLSTAAQTALIDGSGGGEVLGNVTTQRYLAAAYGYNYLSSPFTAATVGGLSSYVNLTAAFPQFYSYDEAQAASGWIADTVSANVLNPLHGYAGIFGSSLSAATVSLTGVVNNHSVSSTLYNHNNTYTLGYNLAGNPYPSPIDWNAASGWTKTNIDNAIYYFNASDTNQYTGTYSSYVSGVSSDGIANNIIPAMQGFFVHVSNGTYPVTATLAINNPARINNLTAVYHKQAATNNMPLLRLTAGFSNAGTSADAVVLYYNDSATDLFDGNLDALKLINTNVNVPSLYAISQDAATNYSIQALVTTPPDSISVVPLGLQTMIDGWVTFTAHDIENISPSQHIYFYDTKAGASQDLQSNRKYSQYIGAGKYEGRFFLMFTTRDKTSIPVLNTALNAYAKGEQLFVYLTAGNGELIITDMLGQVICKKQLSGNGYHGISLQVSSGVYVVTLISDMGKQSKKIFIGNE